MVKVLSKKIKVEWGNMEKLQFIEYILSSKVVELKEVLTKFDMNHEQFLVQINQFNKISFQQEFVVEDNLIIVKNKINNRIVDTKSNRQKELAKLWFTNQFTIDELEIIFGRSRKTLYKDIQQIKKKLLELSSTTNSIQMQLNIFTFDQLEEIANYKNITTNELLSAICNMLKTILNVDCSIREIIELNINYIENDEYAEESRIFASEVIHAIETYLKVKFINDFKKQQIARHIDTSFYKYVNNIFIPKSKLVNVFPRDSERFERISTIMEMLFKSKKLYYSEEELLYLSLYFLDVKDFAYIKVKVDEFEGSRKLYIEKQLLDNFDNFLLTNDKADYVVSSVTKTADTVIKLNFDVNDIKQISKRLKLKSNRVEETKLYFKLKSLLRKNVSLDEFSSVLTSEKRQTKRSLLECFNDEGFYSCQPTSSSSQTIEEISNLLKSRGSVGEEYQDSIKLQMELYSTEFKLINNVALIHAPIADHVYKSDLIMAYSENGFVFSNSVVNFIVAFSAIDDIDLLLPLQDLYTLLSLEDFSDYLDTKPSSKEFCSFLEQSLKKI